MSQKKPKQVISAEDAEELIKINGGYSTQDREIRVSADDIEHAKARDQHNCAIVRAIQRKYPEAIRVRANTEHIGFSIGEERYTYPTPPEAIEAIIKPLDTGHIPEPATIRLRNGKVKPVEHNTDRALVERKRWRNTPDEVKDNYPSRRSAQMSPAYREINRISGEDAK